ncbi:TIGR02679 domain-containing protein [Marinisporobacter balticus]|uniref:Uncharacterized protein (TIGR02679 family) n=1 Tax=Marinisporobacter balticus TaxID=2018667 RepID=A0A4R2KU46_9FIRM|nr:TIGR02679 domain-containing protein [Marinisporobacter balticus]TCO77394.1 uncharacterized protein (TIGR02679 family) [Marinisporobacter balticus]
MDNKVKEAICFLTEQKGYKRILKGILDKYKQLGKLSGMIVLEDLSHEEGIILGAIDYKFYAEKRGKISVKKFVDSFCKGRFEGIDFTEVLKIYFKDDLLTNKALKEMRKNKRETYFFNILNQFENTKAYQWLKAVLDEKNHGYHTLIKKYEESQQDLKYILINIRNALNILSFSKKSLMPLPLFSSKVTKDSHYFDINRIEGKLLIHAICHFLNEKYPLNAEEMNEVLYQSGIVRDEISNSTITFGLMAYRKNEAHLGFKSFLDNGEPLQLSIKNLRSIEKIKAKGYKVFVFENPTAFAGVMEKTLDLYPSLICTSGQLNISALMLLDKLVEGGAMLYYAGDFDPEGLQIADKLKIRYKENLILWRFSVEDYRCIKGEVSIKERENKLLNIQSEELLPLRDFILKEGVAGYQELLIDAYVEDIRNI